MLSDEDYVLFAASLRLVVRVVRNNLEGDIKNAETK